MKAENKLGDLRAEMNGLDEVLVSVLLARKRLSRKIQDYKTEQGLPVQDIARESEILEGLARKNKKDDTTYLQHVYIVILRFCLEKSQT